MCVFKTEKMTQFYVTFHFTAFLTIILQDMIKCNMNFQKSLELNKKKYLQKPSKYVYIIYIHVSIILNLLNVSRYSEYKSDA